MAKYRRRPAMRRRRKYNRPTGRIARGRLGRSQMTVHRFKRSFYKAGAFASDPSSDVLIGFVGQLNSLPSYTDFVNLFDQYRIDKLRVTLYPRQNVTNGNFQPPMNDTIQSCQVFSVVDYDDGNAPTSIDQLCQYQNMKTTRGLRVHSRVWKPTVDITATNGGAPGGTYLRTSPWLDLNFAAQWHNGLKIVFQNTGGFSGVVYDMKVDYYLSMKNVR